MGQRIAFTRRRGRGRRIGQRPAAFLLVLDGNVCTSVMPMKPSMLLTSRGGHGFDAGGKLAPMNLALRGAGG